MTEEQALPLTAVYGGWDAFQRSLVKVIAPLSSAQLALPTAPHHWSIGMVVQHILANRVFWPRVPAAPPHLPPAPFERNALLS